MKILVTGMGIVSSIGSNVEENFNSLKEGRSGIAIMSDIPNMRKSFLGGQVKMSNKELKNNLGIAENEKVHRSGLFGLMAAKEAWGEREHDLSIRTGIIFGTTVGGVDLSDELINEQLKNKKRAKIDFYKTHDSGFGTDFIAAKMGINEYKATISTACSTAANSIMLGARLIKANMLDRVLAGGAEALSNYTLNGFDSLMLYDTEKCKPFDENRKGLNLGEAGGFLVLENERAASLSGKEKLAELSGWANTCDSYHITASSPEGTGASLAIARALQMANLSVEAIDYINAHGTGTPNNDISEANALFSIFGKNMPPFSSTKSFTGHTLAAAGVVEAIYSVLAIRNNIIFPNLNFNKVMKEISLRPENKLIINRKIKNVISNSFGFGGNCTELIFSE